MEKWRQIPGFEGLYEASFDGQIRTVEGKTTYSVRHGERHWKQRILKQHYCQRKGRKNADARVTLWKDKRPMYYLVSRLIAMAWCNGYSPELTVNHIDGNPKNNCANNLEWITRAENIRDAQRNGVYAATQESVVLVDKGGKEYAFQSMAEASRFLGKNSGYISGILSSQRPLFVDGYSIYPF